MFHDTTSNDLQETSASKNGSCLYADDWIKSIVADADNNLLHEPEEGGTLLPGDETDSALLPSLETDSALLSSLETDSSLLSSLETDSALLPSLETDNALLPSLDVETIKSLTSSLAEEGHDYDILTPPDSDLVTDTDTLDYHNIAFKSESIMPTKVTSQLGNEIHTDGSNSISKAHDGDTETEREASDTCEPALKKKKLSKSKKKKRNRDNNYNSKQKHAKKVREAFCKRRQVLVKKARELSNITGADIFLFVKRKKHVSVFGTSNMLELYSDGGVSSEIAAGYNCEIFDDSGKQWTKLSTKKLGKRSRK